MGIDWKALFDEGLFVPFGPLGTKVINAFINLLKEKSMVLTSEGVDFPKAGIKGLPWELVIDIAMDKESGAALITFRGGLRIIVEDDDWCIAVDKEDQDRFCKQLDRVSEHEDFDAKAFIKMVSKATNPSAIVRCSWEDYTRAIALFRDFMKDENIHCHPYFPADAFHHFLETCQHLPDSDSIIDAALREEMKDAARFWADQLPTGKDADDDDRELFAWLKLRFAQDPITPAEALSQYDYFLNLRPRGNQNHSDQALQNARQELLETLGGSSFAPARKFIVCQELSCSVPRECGQTVPGVAVLLAQDIEAYNARQESPETRLFFQPGHPRNGFTYVQHPLRPNVYFDVDAFHANMLASKHSELMYLLENLGARSVSLSVVNTVKEGRTTSHNVDVSAGGKLKVTSGSAHVNDQATCGIDAALYQKLSESAEFTGAVEPHIPDDLLFFPHEEQWQRMAQTALKHGYRRTHVKLEYRQDYAVSQRHMTEVEAKLKLLIPSFDMHLKTDFSEEVKRMTETVWDYEVDFGEAPAAPAPAEAPTGTLTREESLFLKRARRFATDDGKIDREERAELAELAKELGIPRLRMEELIETAFE